MGGGREGIGGKGASISGSSVACQYGAHRETTQLGFVAPEAPKGLTSCRILPSRPLVQYTQDCCAVHLQTQSIKPCISAIIYLRNMAPLLMCLSVSGFVCTGAIGVILEKVSLAKERHSFATRLTTCTALRGSEEPATEQRPITHPWIQTLWSLTGSAPAILPRKK